MKTFPQRLAVALEFVACSATNGGNHYELLSLDLH